ncbi:MAG: hypothetical protein DRH57_00255 [Candidatus Cloacimonadota bacterium]|nr:MAG: hypothetical protein DRH57_00255 [Candidatus Cloacimonadota bacterium]
MPISYDSSTNTISVVGGSEASPYSFEDIYQADQNNGWGVVSKPTGDSYVIGSKLVIGDGSTWTYFADKEKLVIFTPTLDYHEAIILIKRHAYFWIGEGDEDTRTGHKGCVFDVREAVFNSWAFVIYNESEGDIRLYGVTIFNKRFEGYRHNLWLRGSVNRVWSCQVKGGGSGIYPTENLDINEFLVQDCGQGWIYGYNPVYPITKINVEYNNTGVYFYADQVYNLRNARFMKNNRTIHTSDLRASARLTDCEADDWSIDWAGSPDLDKAKVERAYTFSVKITDRSGNPIQNALVELYDRDGNLVFAELTNVDGEISEHSIVSITYTPTETIDNNPYTVKITKDGYTSLEAQITIDRPMKNLIWQLDALDYTLDEIMQELQSHRDAVEPKIDVSISSRSSHTPADVWTYPTRELTNPDNYKADISDLARESTVQAIKSQTDKLQFNTDSDVKATLDGERVRLTSDIELLLNIILGLVQHNYRLFNTTYTEIKGMKKLTSATVKVYSSREDCENDVNPLKVYDLQISYDEDGCVVDYRSVES